jgi:predicted alpha/beta-hydrolase family hydrolase
VNEEATRFLATEEKGDVSGLFTIPDGARSLVVLGHAASTDIHHRSMSHIARSLAEVGIGTLRYNFPYMEAGGRRVDSRAVCYATVRSAVSHAGKKVPALALFAGGRSFGGRMTSMAAADDALGVRGIIFYAFPLHPAKKPGIERAAHLMDTGLPMLFLSGTRDALADLTLLEPVVADLAGASLHILDTADHSFGVLKRSGHTEESTHVEAASVVRAFVQQIEEAL